MQLLDTNGLSVISDIDDTIKETNVTQKRQLLRNTSLREFRAIDGMADFYARLRDAGRPFTMSRRRRGSSIRS